MAKKRNYLDIMPRSNTQRTVDELLPTYDAAQLMHDNYKPDDQSYNIGYLLGTLWGNQYNKRGEKKSMSKANAMLHDEQAKMKGIENEGQRANKAFNKMIADPQPMMYDVAASTLQNLQGKDGEYANPNKFEGYASKLAQSPAEKIAEPDNSFRAEKFIPDLVSKLEADGRTDYQINYVLNKLSPQIAKMDKDAKFGRSMEMARAIMEDPNAVDLSDPEVMGKLSKIQEDNPTMLALLLNNGMTKFQREDREDAKADRELDRKIKELGFNSKQDEYNWRKENNYWGKLSDYGGKAGSGSGSGRTSSVLTSPIFKYAEERLKEYADIPDEELTPQQKHDKAYWQLLIYEGEKETGLVVPGREEKIAGLRKVLNNYGINPNDYNEASQWIDERMKYLVDTAGMTERDAAQSILNAYGDAPNGSYVPQLMREKGYITSAEDEPKGEATSTEPPALNVEKEQETSDYDAPVNPNTGFRTGSFMDNLSGFMSSGNRSAQGHSGLLGYLESSGTDLPQGVPNIQQIQYEKENGKTLEKTQLPKLKRPEEFSVIDNKPTSTQNTSKVKEATVKPDGRSLTEYAIENLYGGDKEKAKGKTLSDALQYNFNESDRIYSQKQQKESKPALELNAPQVKESSLKPQIVKQPLQTKQEQQKSNPTLELNAPQVRESSLKPRIVSTKKQQKKSEPALKLNAPQVKESSLKPQIVKQPTLSQALNMPKLNLPKINSSVKPANAQQRIAGGQQSLQTPNVDTSKVTPRGDAKTGGYNPKLSSWRYDKSKPLVGPQGSSGLVNTVRSLSGKVPFDVPKNPTPEQEKMFGWLRDGTTCVFTMGQALKGTPFEGVYHTSQLDQLATQYGLKRDASYKPKPGDIAIVKDNGHAVMVTEDGGTIQNGRSAETVWESGLSPKDMFGKVDYYIQTSIFEPLYMNKIPLIKRLQR